MTPSQLVDADSALTRLFDDARALASAEDCQDMTWITRYMDPKDVAPILEVVRAMVLSHWHATIKGDVQALRAAGIDITDAYVDNALHQERERQATWASSTVSTVSSSPNTYTLSS